MCLHVCVCVYVYVCRACMRVCVGERVSEYATSILARQNNHKQLLTLGLVKNFLNSAVTFNSLHCSA